jgi:hypothetical protein
MTKCDGTLKIDFPKAGFIEILCGLEKDHKGKHRYEAKSEGKLFKIEWWDELPVIKKLSEMYVEKNVEI